MRILDSDITMNSATGENGAGGGILSVGGILNVRRSQISGNQATVFGGGIEVIDGYAKLENSVLGEFGVIGGNLSGLDGGGLHVSGVEGSTVEFDETEVRSNFAARDGGGAWIQANSLFIVHNSSNFRFNEAGSDVNGGGGIFNLGGTVMIDNSEFFQNSASGENSLGGAIHSLGGVVTATNNSSFVFNNAQRGGGGISILGGQLNLTESTVSNNFAEGGDGGGIYVAVDGEAILDNSLVSANTAMRGGGIGGFDANVVVKNDSGVVGNRAQLPAEGAGIGGGIYTQGGLLRILDSAITDNEALSFHPGEALGGGIANLSGIVNLRNSAVISNGANGNGGGIHIMAGTASIQNTVFGGIGPSDGNFAIHGAGIYFDSLSLASIVGGRITQNVASIHGGGIFNHPTSNLQISEDTVIFRNTADVGGGIYNSGMMSMIYVIVSQNIAGTGGGLSNQPAAIAVIDTVDIDGNGASFVGGGVDNSGIVNFTNQVVVRNNVAVVTGGGVFTENIGLSIFNDVTFSNNIPDDTNN